MKLFNGKNGRALVAGLSLLAGAGAVHAYDSESGQIKAYNYATGYLSEGTNVAGLVMASPAALGTGRCNGPLYFELDGEGSKALAAAIVAASVAGSSVTVEYLYSSEDNSCLLAAVHFN